MRHFALSLITALITLTSVRAQWPNAEHLLYVRIETTPTAATLSSVPVKEGDTPIIIGKTPLVIPIEMNWDTSYLRKKWDKIRVATRTGIATNSFDPTDKTHTIALTFSIEKEGHQSQIVQQIAAVLEYDAGASDWDHAIKALPERRTLSYTLIPLATNEAPASTNPTTGAPKITPPTVIVARGASTDASKLGYAVIESSSPTTVFVNGMSAGTSPLRLMLPEGTHTIGTALKGGKQAPSQNISIEAGKTITVILEAASK